MKFVLNQGDAKKQKKALPNVWAHRRYRWLQEGGYLVLNSVHMNPFEAKAATQSSFIGQPPIRLLYSMFKY
jgi:hypothetical protein